nr:ribonuclease H-like domain-containing protein [Tanacetum cinerariifolium]
MYSLQVLQVLRPQTQQVVNLNDVKARTTLLLSLPDEHQLRFNKYKNVRELWAAILKTFSGNEATKKTKKNLLKQQCGNFKAEGSETLEQTFNRLQVIVALAQVESRLVEYKEREVKYCEKIRTLEFMNESNNECIEILKKKLETLKEEKEGVDGKLACLLTASKNLGNLIESQRSDKNKEGLGYSAVPPPPAQLYLSPKKDLS